jgi:ATP-binding cassette subfamily C protein LapB
MKFRIQHSSFFNVVKKFSFFSQFQTLKDLFRTPQKLAAQTYDVEMTTHLQMSLTRAVRHFLAANGLNYSEVAVRDLSEIGTVQFGPAEAVSALNSLGFASGFGLLEPKNIIAEHCPLIAFEKSGLAITILEIDSEGMMQIMPHETTAETFRISRIEMEAKLQPFAILTRQTRTSFENQTKRNWFWDSMLEGKWLYAQVIFAAMMTNFLGLATSLFSQVVYDRVVPNNATESLIALTFGILIALGCDFIIKSLRAQFIDKAGKGADIKMSRMIFDKILNLKLDTRQRKSGAMATIVREFDTLREFFTSATLVAVVDLPFIFFYLGNLLDCWPVSFNSTYRSSYCDKHRPDYPTVLSENRSRHDGNLYVETGSFD